MTIIAGAGAASAIMNLSGAGLHRIPDQKLDTVQPVFNKMEKEGLPRIPYWAYIQQGPKYSVTVHEWEVFIHCSLRKMETVISEFSIAWTSAWFAGTCKKLQRTKLLFLFRRYARVLTSCNKKVQRWRSNVSGNAWSQGREEGPSISSSKKNPRII